MDHRRCCESYITVAKTHVLTPRRLKWLIVTVCSTLQWWSFVSVTHVALEGGEVDVGNEKHRLSLMVRHHLEDGHIVAFLEDGNFDICNWRRKEKQFNERVHVEGYFRNISIHLFVIYESLSLTPMTFTTSCSSVKWFIFSHNSCVVSSPRTGLQQTGGLSSIKWIIWVIWPGLVGVVATSCHNVGLVGFQTWEVSYMSVIFFLSRRVIVFWVKPKLLSDMHWSPAIFQNFSWVNGGDRKRSAKLLVRKWPSLPREPQLP